MNKNKELFLNTFYFGIGNLGSKIIGFLMVPLYTIWLTPEEYGLVDLIQTYNNIFILIVGLGIADSLVVFPINKKASEVAAQLSTGFIFHLLFVFLFFVIFVFLDYLRFELLDSINNVLWYAYVMLVSSTTCRFFHSYCRGVKKIKIFSYTGIIQAMSIAFFSFLMIPYYKVYGYLIALILSNFVVIAFILLYTRAYSQIHLNLFSKEILKEMLNYSLPLIPNSIMWWLILSLNRPLLEKYDGVAAIGILAVASKIPTILEMFYNFFHQSWIITIVQEYKSNNFLQYYNNVLNHIVAFQSLLSVVIMVLGGQIVDLFIDEKFYTAREYIPFMCVTVIISNIATFTTSIFNAEKKTTYIFYSVIFASVSSVILNVIFIPIWGIWGALVSMIVAHATAAVSRILFGWRYVEITRIHNLLANILLSLSACYADMYFRSSVKYFTLLLLICFWFFLNKESVFKISEVLKKRLYVD